MRGLIVASALVVALVVPLGAHAADLRPARPVYKAPPPTPVTTWSGFYLGAYGGSGGGISRWDFSAIGTTTGDFDISGDFAGGTAGFNWQVGSTVFGIEADGGWAGFSGSAPDVDPRFTIKTNDSWLSSLRARAGWVIGPNVLLYATAGGAFGDVSASVPVVPVGSALPAGSGATGTNAGWAAGAGAEWMFTPGWSAKLEYMHYDLGTFTCPAHSCGLNPANVRFEVDTGKVGINYHWGATGPF